MDEPSGRPEIEVAFLALHGRGGEDGCVQGMLELMGVPVHGLQRARQRARDGQAQGEGDVPPPQRADAAVLRGDARRPRRPRGDPRELRLPVIVKPRREGSAVGITKAKNMAELAPAIEVALVARRHVLVERFIKATEVPSASSTVASSAPRDRPQERPLRLCGQVHGRHDRVHRARRACLHAAARRHEPRRARGAGARLHGRVPR